MSSGGSSAPSSQVVRQETTPPYLAPYLQDIAARTQAVSREPYIPYKAPRIAGFTPQQVSVMEEAATFERPQEYAQASEIYGGMGRLEGPSGIEQYMNPYQQAVTDTALRTAREEAARQRGVEQMGLAAKGSAGGSRAAIMDAMRESKLTQTLADTQARGRAAAFADARAAQQQQATGLMGLAAQRQASDTSRLKTQQQYAAQPQALQQQILQQRYADFLRQRDYPKEQLAAYSAAIRGFPMPRSTSEVTYAREPSLGRDLAGLGIAALGTGMRLSGSGGIA